ncbi:MAG TPA: acyltransferase [Acidimicrobiia bacterium]
MTTMERAAEMARATPSNRNRYVDFLRAASILVVVVGHWLMAAPVMTASGLVVDNLLSHNTWTHYLTWVVQVMPIFFFVGGFANAASWRRARDLGDGYPAWLRARLRRLVLPVLPLLAVWAGGGWLLLRAGVDAGLLGLGSQAALVPVWFLAAYLTVVALTPLTLRVWERYGFASLVVTAALAAAADLSMLAAGIGWAGYLNYLFVWATVHGLGYAWADGRMGKVATRLRASVAGLIATAGLVALGPYPVAMVGLDTMGVTNSQPPKVTLVALAVFQIGLLLALEKPARRFLAGEKPWAATILVNGRIMTIYLWHLTAMVTVIGLAALAGGSGLSINPDTSVWWLTRPLWIGLLALATLPFLLAFGRYERPGSDRRPAPIWWRPILAVVATTAGLALLARYGIADREGLHGIALTLPFAAAVAGGIGGARLWERRRRRPHQSETGKATSQAGSSGPIVSQSAK